MLYYPLPTITMRTKKTRRYDDQLDREIEKAVSKFSEHLMSNSKWLRLIDGLVEKISGIQKIQFKQVQKDEIGELSLTEDTTFEFDYWKNGFEGHNSLGGWLTFKEIEYLVFPQIIDSKTNRKQDLNKILEIINSLGKFSLHIEESEIKLICYK